MDEQPMTWKFWTSFILVSGLFLGVWYFYWATRSGSLDSLTDLSNILPVSEELRGDLGTVIKIAQAFYDTGGEEKIFLVLFQNNMELRPGGGFIGSFGILKVKDGSVTDFASHDVINFDGRIPDTVPAPYPMKETLGVKSLKLRDSNISPDWSVNAKAAEDFYHLGEGKEEFDGVIGITTNVLSSFLSVTGPVSVPGYPGEYDAETGVLDLEYQVEQAFYKQGISRGDRKAVMHELGNIILARVKELSFPKKYELFKVALDDLHKKDIQIMFKDEALQSVVQSAGWSGEVDRVWDKDYLLVVDSNLNALKSDFRMRRSFEYVVDLRSSPPLATLTVSYEHTAKEKDYMTRDYQTFARVYVPEGSWLSTVTGSSKPAVFGNELGKKYFGSLVHVPLGTTKQVVWTYRLPESLGDDYDLKIEKQAGVNDIPVRVTVLRSEDTKEYEFVLNRPLVLSKEGE
jgi:hypothetical protein